MKILITGSDGFVGKNLLKRLKYCSYYKIDLKLGSDINFINKVRYDPDVIIHLAAETSVFNNDIKKIIHTNVSGFTEVVSFANKNNAKLIYASSSSANNITSMYGISKKMNEDYAKAYCNNSIGIRFHNVYGNNQRADTLLGLINSRSKLNLYNNGNNTRHFTHINNILDCIVYYVYNNINTDIVNVLNPIKNSVIEFVQECNKYINVDYQITKELKEYDKESQKVDGTMFEKTKYINIKQGLKKYFNEQNRTQ